MRPIDRLATIQLWFTIFGWSAVVVAFVMYVSYLLWSL